MDNNVMSYKDRFDEEFLRFYMPFHEKFSEWQRDLAKTREERVEFVNDYHMRVGYDKHYKAWVDQAPKKTSFPDDYIVTPRNQTRNPHTGSLNTHHHIPTWAKDQRNQMTGPADDAALIVKMMNSGAPGVMIDIEDSMANNWDNLYRAFDNIQKLFNGELTYQKKVNTAPNATQQIAVQNPSSTTTWIRVRGLHMTQVLKFPISLQTVKTPASLLDVCLTAFTWKKSKYLLPVKQPLAFYIPKTEYAEEALWWSTLFREISDRLGWPFNYIKCMALVESHALAYQMDEFIYLMKDHIIGLNLGRWDYMASLIELNMWNPKWVLPDRNSIPHDVAFFQNLRKHMVNVCHSRGILAIGGMTALYPSRKDAELNERALKSLESDKSNEAEMGMDGAWTGHPDQNAIAVKQFPAPNQVGRLHADPDTFEWEREPDLRPPFTGDITVQGTRDAIRSSIRYRNGVLNGRGASLLDGYMEDLATDRINRNMIEQRMRHRDDHTPELVTRLFNEELERLLKEGTEPGTEETLRKARLLTEEYVTTGRRNPN